MKIQSKLTILLMAGMAGATAASAFGFIQLQRQALRESEAEKTRLLLEGISQMAGESLLAKDPLMLLDFLEFMRQNRPEIHHVRVRRQGRWQDIGGQPPPESPGGVEKREVAPPAATPGAKDLLIEVHLSADFLARREQRALRATVDNVLRAGGGVLAVGLILSIFISRRLTNRLVLIERAVDAIGEGKLGEVAETQGSDEISRLARGVNTMSSKLKELDDMKRTFVASITHELRSPLGAIEAYVKDMLSQSNGWSEEDRKSLGRIQRNAARLEHFVTNLLEMSKIERGKLDFHPRTGRVGILAEDTAAFFKPRAKAAGITLLAQVEGGLPTFLLDPDLVTQILTNLVSNAIKFTRQGGRVWIAVRKVPEGVECSVEDTGVGIPEAALARVFAPFERIRNPLKASGAGLGLAISKSIVEMHGGSIRAESKIGRGSRFSFILPLKPPSRKPAAG